MFGLLRFVRAIVGIVLGMRVIGLISDITGLVAYLGNADVPMKMTPLAVSVDLAVLLAAFACFTGLRRFINWLHNKRFGRPHPALLKEWSL